MAADTAQRTRVSALVNLLEKPPDDSLQSLHWLLSASLLVVVHAVVWRVARNPSRQNLTPHYADFGIRN
jgi:cytochrome c-type biogenesis protein CcmH/NrfF